MSPFGSARGLPEELLVQSEGFKDVFGVIKRICSQWNVARFWGDFFFFHLKKDMHSSSCWRKGGRRCQGGTEDGVVKTVDPTQGLVFGGWSEGDSNHCLRNSWKHQENIWPAQPGGNGFNTGKQLRFVLGVCCFCFLKPLNITNSPAVK